MKTTDQEVPHTQEEQTNYTNETISHTQTVKEPGLESEGRTGARSKQHKTIVNLIANVLGGIVFVAAVGTILTQQREILKENAIYKEEVQQLNKLKAANNERIDTLNQLKSAGTGFTPTHQQEITSYVDSALSMQQNELPNIEETTRTIRTILSFKEDHLAYTLDDDIGLALNNVKEQRKLLAEPQNLEDYKAYYNLTKTPKLDK